jgi:hypothetical protein
MVAHRQPTGAKRMPCRPSEFAALAATLRANPAAAEAVATVLEAIAAEAAEHEAAPVPAGLRG